MTCHTREKALFSANQINLGDPVETTIRGLAETVIDLCSSASSIEYQLLSNDETAQRQPDITLARAVLGWEARTGLADGLQRTIAYFDRMLKSSK